LFGQIGLYHVFRADAYAYQSGNGYAHRFYPFS